MNRHSRRLLATIAVIASAVGLCQRSAGADVTDIVFVVDTSGDMGSEILFLQSALPTVQQQFDSYGDDVRYGLIEFVETSFLTQNLTDFATFTAAGGAWDTLAADSTETIERGSTAILTNNPALDFRSPSKRHVVLITSETDGSSSADKAAAAAVFDELGPAFWLLWDDSSTTSGSIIQSYQHLSANGQSFDGTGAPLYFEYTSFGQLGHLIHNQNFLTPSVPEPAAGLLGVACVSWALRRRRWVDIVDRFCRKDA